MVIMIKIIIIIRRRNINDISTVKHVQAVQQNIKCRNKFNSCLLKPENFKTLRKPYFIGTQN